MSGEPLAKLSPDLRMLAGATRPGGAPERVRVLVKFQGPVERLREIGVEVGNVAADIATATVAVDQLPQVAAAPEVIYVEGSRALGPD